MNDNNDKQNGKIIKIDVDRFFRTISRPKEMFTTSTVLSAH